jgi:hypothetical protein
VVQRMRKVKLEDLKPGDLIAISWSDAWEADKVPLSEKSYDVVWHEWGVFLFTRGKHRKHLVMAFSKKPGDITDWNFTAIPTKLILRAVLVEPRFLQKFLPDILEKLLRKAKVSCPRRFLLIAGSHKCFRGFISWSERIL